MSEFHQRFEVSGVRQGQDPKEFDATTALMDVDFDGFFLLFTHLEITRNWVEFIDLMVPILPGADENGISVKDGELDHNRCKEVRIPNRQSELQFRHHRDCYTAAVEKDTNVNNLSKEIQSSHRTLLTAPRAHCVDESLSTCSSWSKQRAARVNHTDGVCRQSIELRWSSSSLVRARTASAIAALVTADQTSDKTP